jgi:predicted dehydrogenase
MEKPITVTEAEADDLIAAAEETGRTLAVAENTRYVTAYVEALRLLQDGAIGDVRMIRGFIPDQILDEWADRSDPTQDWKREPGGCGAIMDCAPHMLYLLVWYFGEVETLQAFARGWVPDIPLDNHGIVAGKMASGPFFAMEFCSLTEYPRGERLEIYGTKGSIIVDQVLDPPMVVYAGDRDPHGTPVEGIGYDLAGWKPASIAATAHDFVAAVREAREPSVTAADSRYVTSLVERAYRSAEQGGVPVDGRDRPAAA